MDRTEAALLEDTDRVELVLRRRGAGHYRVAAADGWCEFRRAADGHEVVEVGGRHPVADQATDRLLGLDVEIGGRFPTPDRNAYPHAFERIDQLFDHPDAPDLAVVRTAAFHVHGNLGEHGSLGAVQSRGAFVAGGAGIRADGVVDRHLLAVDVAPTMAAVLGCTRLEGGHHLLAQDGMADERLLSGEIARHAIAFLFDGLNANVLHHALAAGDVPNIAAVVARGTSYREGSIASFPTVTLPNHTTLLTGLHPGHHGVLANTWHQRGTGATPDLLDGEQMFTACRYLLPGVETVFEAVARTRRDAWTAATYEYADRGADWSTYGELRAERRPEGVPRKDAPVPGATDRWFAPDTRYRFMSRIDTASTHQACTLLRQRDGNPIPTFLWVNYSLTDEASHHGGPHGEEARDALRDTDARMGEVLEAAAEAGILEDTAVFVLADHGMEQTDPSVTGTYRDRLDAAGVDYRDVDDGFLYLDA